MKRQSEATIPTPWGKFLMTAYADSQSDRLPTLAIRTLDFDPARPVLIRLHSECLTGDIFHSKRCDCGLQLQESLKKIATEGGLLIYLRQEGRGIGLINKLKAYNLQDEGLDTAAANLHLGFEVDERDYSLAVTILQDLKVKKVKLLTNNPLKIRALQDSDIEVVERVPLIMPTTQENAQYIQTKKDLMDHLL